MKKFSFKDYVDPVTGEVRTFVLVGHEFEDTDFVKVPFVSLNLIMNDKDLAKSSLKLLSYIIRHKISFSNYKFSLSYKYDVKGVVDMTERQFHRALNKLLEKDLLRKEGRGRFMLNPKFFRYGSVDMLKKFEAEYEELKKKQVRTNED